MKILKRMGPRIDPFQRVKFELVPFRQQLISFLHFAFTVLIVVICKHSRRSNECVPSVACIYRKISVYI